LPEFTRQVLTLVVVTVVAAGLLAGANMITAPVIAERQAEDYRSALEEYFPDMAEFKTEVLDEGSFDLVYNAGGELLGVMASASVQGYDGPISYNLAVDKEGAILGLRIVEHTETQGVGDVIEKPEFQNQFLGKSCLDPLQIGEDVDTVSGATISTSAMINSMRQLLSVVAENLLLLETEEPLDITAVPDGAYRGSGEGYLGEIGVEVTVDSGKVTAIEIVEHHEKPTYLVEAVASISPQIIDGQTLEVDTKTGATESSIGIVDAVKDALTKALNAEDVESGEDDG
jgi:RnfABCDGE-type electron transport complex G subunit